MTRTRMLALLTSTNRDENIQCRIQRQSRLALATPSEDLFRIDMPQEYLLFMKEKQQGKPMKTKNKKAKIKRQNMK